MGFNADEMQTLVVRDGRDSINYYCREFESNCFNNRTVEISSWDAESFTEAFSELKQHLGTSPGDLFFLRLPSQEVKKIASAEAAGFYFVESTIIPYINLRTWKEERFARFVLPLEAVDDGTFQEVFDIASTTFRGLRFNLDSNIGDEESDLRYGLWLKNAYQSGQDLRCMRIGGSIAAFCLLRFLNEEKVIFHLGGIHPKYKGSGVGLMLYASVTAYCKSLGIKTIDGGISVANIPVLNTMSSLGYVFKDSTVVLHCYIK